MTERQHSGRGRDTLRTESPAAGPAGGGRSGYIPPHLRGGARDESPASSDGGSRPPPVAGASDGKYRPGAFRRTAN